MKYLSALFLLVAVPAILNAQQNQPAVKPSVLANAPVNKASDASFDKRLPPVLPGERVNDNGRDMRVWSTAGEVPVSQAPQPFEDRQLIEDVLRNPGIFVDERGRQPGPPANAPVAPAR